MKIRKKLGIWLLAFTLVLTGLSLSKETGYAAPTASFSVSGGNAALGGNVSVTVSVSGSENIAFAQVSLNYSANILEYQSGADSGGSGRVNILFDCGSGKKSASRTITFKAVATGKASLSLDNAQATPMDVNSGDWMSASVAGGGSVTVGESKSLSKDAHIASIEVSPGTLKPAFDPDKFKYTMEVENNVTSIAVSAKASHAAAKITAVNGATDLKVGSNKVSVICTAENGGTAAYVITVTRKAAGTTEKPQTTKPAQEEPPKEEEPETGAELTAELNGATYFVGQGFKDTDIPTGFEAGEVQYGGQAVKGALCKNNNEVQLLYLLNSEKKDGKFFIYYPGSGIVSEFVQVSFYEGNVITFLDPASLGKEIPVDIVESLFTVDDRELKGYKLKSPKTGIGDPSADAENGWILDRVSANPEEFVFFYGLNQEGSVSWYSYDLSEKTLQRLVVFTSQVEEAEPESTETAASDGTESSVKKMLQTVKVYRIVLLGAAAIILLLILLCALIAINSKKAKSGDEEDEEEDDFEEEEQKAEEKKAAKKPEVKEKAEATKVMPVKDIQKAAPEKEEAKKEEAKKEEAKKEAPKKEMPAKEVPEKKDTDDDDLGLEFFDLDDF